MWMSRALHWRGSPSTAHSVPSVCDQRDGQVGEGARLHGRVVADQLVEPGVVDDQRLRAADRVLAEGLVHRLVAGAFERAGLALDEDIVKVDQRNGGEWRVQQHAGEPREAVEGGFRRAAQQTGGMQRSQSARIRELGVVILVVGNLCRLHAASAK